MLSRRPDLVRECNSAGVRFLLAEIESGLTFLSIASTSPLAGSRERCLSKAHEVYSIVLQLLPRLEPAPEQARELHERMEALRGGLLAAGFSLEPPVLSRRSAMEPRQQVEQQ